VTVEENAVLTIEKDVHVVLTVDSLKNVVKGKLNLYI